MKKVNFYKWRINKLRRHFRIIYPYITFGKLANIFRGEMALLRGLPNVKNFPYALKIEPTVLCNLNCPGCFRATTGGDRKNNEMDFKLFQKIVDELSDYLLEITLYDQGEPLVCNEISSFIKYAHQNNIATVISSNFSMELSDRKLKSIIESGLDYLIIAADGITQETYQKYRQGGNLEKLLSNLKRIVKLKETMNMKKPLIEWQMIDFDWNKGEQALSEKTAYDYGCNYFRIVKDGSTLNKNQNYLRKKKCPLLWFSFSIEINGDLSACYINDDDSLDMGNCQVNSIGDIWFSRSYAKLREKHNKASGENLFCHRCQMHD